jgi:hypothetical protein
MTAKRKPPVVVVPGLIRAIALIRAGKWATS